MSRYYDSEVDNIENEYNKSTYFLLPMLGVPLRYYNNLINCYMGDINAEKIDNYHLYILLEEEDDKIRGIDGFLRQYETSDGVMYVFRINDRFDEDYIKFTQGQYSQFSTDYKNKIIKLLPMPFKDNNIYKVITKSKEAKKIIEQRIGQSIGDQEVLSIPNLEVELYDNKWKRIERS